MSMVPIPRRVARRATLTIALGALAAACGSSSSSASASSLLASVRSHIQSAKTYVATTTISSASVSHAPPTLTRAEVDASTHSELVTTEISGVTLKQISTAGHQYLQLPNVTPTAAPSSTWYELPATVNAIGAPYAQSNRNLARLFDSALHPSLDGHVSVDGTNCTLIVAQVSLAALAKALHVRSSVTGSTQKGHLDLEIAVSPAGYPRRLVERINVGTTKELITEDFSDFGAPLDITPPPPSEIKKISLSQLGGLFEGPFQPSSGSAG